VKRAMKLITAPSAPSPTRTKTLLVAALVALAWLTGAALRLAMPGLIEYKGDEAWTFHAAVQMAHGGQWPRVGMDSSVGLPNPGLSIWIFGALAWISRATTPVGLARAVACMNIVALTVLFVFAWTRRAPYRTVWLWAASLAAVDPLGILQQRKIWPPCTFPLLTLGLFLTWRVRRYRAAAFAWGLLGAFIAQIHMGAVVYVFAFMVWALYEELRPTERHQTRWMYWLGGSIVGALPAIPWLMQLHGTKLAHFTPAASARWGNAWRMWLEDVVGWNLEYSFGPEHALRFLKYPVIAGRETGYVQYALWTSLFVTAALALFAAWQNVREGRRFLDRLKWDGAVGHNIAFFLYGLGMTLPPFLVWRHYLLVTYPFQAMTLPLLAWLAGRKRGCIALAPVWVAHALIAACALAYLFANQGAPGGDFGIAFEFQGRRD
jgi:hypothetical protein